VGQNFQRNITKGSNENTQKSIFNNTNIAAASGQTASVDVDVTGMLSCMLLHKSNATAQTFIDVYMTDGITRIQLDSTTAGTSTQKKFSLSGCLKVAIYTKDTSATANNKVWVDVCLSPS
jgi:L-fucose isomerase-like protein